MVALIDPGPVPAVLLCLCLQLLPNWIITYLLAILLTLMGLRLLTKGKQAYAKETQLLLAAKAAAKERHLQRNRSASLSRRGASVSRRSAVLDALEPAGPEETAALTSSSKGVAVHRARGGSFNRAFSQSFSRLRGGSLVVGYEPPSQQGDVVSTAGSLLLPAGGLLHSRGADLWSPADAAGNDQQLPAPALEQYVRSTLFQVSLETAPVTALCHNQRLKQRPWAWYGVVTLTAAQLLRLAAAATTAMVLNTVFARTVHWPCSIVMPCLLGCKLFL